MKSFKELGVNDELAYACDELGWKNPTKIQVEAIPVALEGKKDIIGVAQTGSGKTGAFAIPILQALLETPHSFFACVLSPTRELAIQVAEQFEALGSGIGIKCAVLVEGVDFVQQSIVLGKLPPIVVATPDRLVYHLCNTNVFSFRMLKFLVLDEADRFLNDDFKLVDEILNVIPPQLRIYLFSATMTKRVIKLQKTCLKDPVKIEAASKYNLRQQVQEAKGISQMKIKEIGGKKRRKGDEDDARNHQASKKKHHPRPLTKLGKKLKEKLEEISLAATPIKTFVEVYGRGSDSYKMVYANGVTVSAYIGCYEEDGYGSSPSPTVELEWGCDEDGDGSSPSPTVEWGEGKQTLALPLPPPPTPV